MDNLIEILNQEIANNDNYFIKQQKINEVKTILNDLLNNHNILYLSKNQYENLLFLFDDLNLNDDEKNFISEIITLDNTTKKVIETLGLDDIQLELIKSIKEKIQKIIEEYDAQNISIIKEKNNQYHDLLLILEHKKQALIIEFELIKELLDTSKIDVEQQIKIFQNINSLNLNMYKTLKNNTEIIHEDELTPTNLNKEQLIELFKKFNLDFNSITGIFKEKILKYGNIHNIEEVLTIITNTNNNLDFLIDKHELLTKVLIYSNKDMLEFVLNIEKDNNIKGITQKLPTILFPPVAEKSKTYTKNKTRNTKKTTYVTGSYYNFKHNIESLKEIGIPVSIVYEKCLTFFTKPYQNFQKVIHNLELYGLNPINKEEPSKTPFSIFRVSDLLLTNIDSAIEADCFEYIKDNYSRLIEHTNIFNRIKLAKKRSLEDINIEFKPFKVLKNGSSKLFLSGEFIKDDITPYGVTEEETYKLYGAKTIEIENQSLYDNIINNSDNNTISELSLNDETIQKLNHMFYSSDMPLIYNFNGVIISRNKVLRYYETLISNNIPISNDLLLYIITYNSMLDEKELENIKQCLKQIKFGGIVKC